MKVLESFLYLRPFFAVSSLGLVQATVPKTNTIKSNTVDNILTNFFIKKPLANTFAFMSLSFFLVFVNNI